MYKIEQTIPKELEYAENLVQLMDDQFKVPFINFRFGLDPLIGLIPVLGDIVDAWDFFNKANRKNLTLAKKHFESN